MMAYFTPQRRYPVSRRDTFFSFFHVLFVLDPVSSGPQPLSKLPLHFTLLVKLFEKMNRS